MQPQSWLTVLQTFRAIAVIRSPQMLCGQKMAISVAQGGMRLIEITWNSDRPAELITRLRSELPNCLIGAGTLLNPREMNEAIASGAQFLFTPHVDPGMIQTAVSHNLPIVAGALSPTEIVLAWQAGATSVKVFPVEALGGTRYLHSLQGPLSHIPLIPTGGVTVENARDFLNAGAIAVGLSGSLFPGWAVEQGDWEAIAQQARILLQNCLADQSLTMWNGQDFSTSISKVS